ncbi:MAG: FAD-dependent oxidoreductase [Rhodocyclaceae bacterium]|nr:FAD-dependent oxidoreductase [Rhodocyclaceae bacterium]MBX3668148.1 FAD-dependent oxidoreductase [Rhodocyclaceae bacterium]
MSDEQTIIIVGGGHAGGELALAVRQNGHQGKILLVGEEPGLPYQRPPLSKGYLAGDLAAAAIQLKPQANFDKAQVEVMSGCRVAAIRRDSKHIELADGRRIGYARLALATGARPRKLPLVGVEAPERLQNFHYLRTFADSEQIRAGFAPGARLVIVGGGYIGLEVAATAIKRGLKVTVLEALPRVLARVTSPEVAEFYAGVHRAAGVDLRTGANITGWRLNAEGSAVSAVQLADGTEIATDLVVAGIGVLPNTELAAAAGLEVDNGIVVDPFARTSDPDIVAAGDCTNHPSALYGRRIRLESVPNALEQARTAAASLCGKEKPYAAVPWFWSDQYDLKLQMVGLNQGYEHCVLRGDPAARSFSAFYLKDGIVIAADTVARMPEFLLAKRLVAERIPVDAAALADDAIPLKTLLPAA